MKISGSIYSDKNRELKETITDLQAHQVDMLHVDCNDDVSVFKDIKQIRTWCDLPIDLHIITETPEKYFGLLRETPVEFVTFQYEQLKEKLVIPADIKGEKGLGIITPTSIDVFDAYADFDFILMMATIPGQSGGVFAPENFQKINHFKKKYPSKNVHVDGGVNGEVSFILRNMGVHASVSGSFLFKNVSIGQALMDLTRRAIKSQFKVRDFMIPIQECPLVQYDSMTFKSVLESIDAGKQGFTLVEENNQFKGIISNADVRKALIRNFNDLQQVDAQKMVNEHPVIISADANVTEMLNVVRSKSFPVMYMPVVNGGNKVEGIITFINLIKGEI